MRRRQHHQNPVQKKTESQTASSFLFTSVAKTFFFMVAGLIFFYLTYLIFRSTPKETCLESTPLLLKPPANNADQNHILFDIHTPEMLKKELTHNNKLKERMGQKLFLQETEFKNTAVHYHLVNHNYKMVRELISLDKGTKNEKGESLKEVRDINGCTLLILSMKVGAPAETSKELISKENVMIADNNGVTPLMWAKRGEDRDLVKAIEDAIGPERMSEAKQAVDNQGRTTKEWSEMSKENLMEEFKKVEVDGSKAANHCRNTIFAHTDHQVFARFIPGLEVGQMLYATQGRKLLPSVKATAANARELIRIATDPSEKDSREIIHGLALIIAADDMEQDPAKYWKKISNSARKLLDEGLSEETLVERYAGRQLGSR